MKRLEGGYLGARPTWTLTSNPGVWSIEHIYARRTAGVWPIGVELYDEFYQYVNLLINGDGPNSSTIIVDRSTNSYTLTQVGNVTISTAQSKFGGSSLFFSGTNYLTQSNISLGLSDFTIEFWMYPTDSSGARGLFTQGTTDSTGSFVWIYQSNAIILYANNQGRYSVGGITVNTWNHVAVTRSGTTYRTFINGVLGGSHVGTYNHTNSPLRIGLGYGGIVNYIGYMDDIRITVGIARYTSGFNVPITPYSIPVADPYFGSVSLLLHMNGANASTYFPDHSYNALAVTANGNAQISTAQSKFGGASALFDGTGDWLSVSTNTVLDLAGVNFTIEAWIYISGLFTANIDGNRVGTILAYGSTTTNQGYELTINQTGNTFALQSNGTANGAFASYTFNTNQWYHVAATRSGSVSQLFVDGQALTLTTNTFPNNSSSNGTLKIGAERLYTGYNHDFNGYIDDVRITKGIARYTSSFIVSSSAFPNS